jgi:sugar/nucleoside kinase (ribokinase family)
MDTKDDPDDKWGGVLPLLLPYIDVLLPNHDELCRMTHCEDIESALAKLSIVPVIAVKCGRDGAIVQSEGRRMRVSGLSVNPVDTIGAGDSFNAGFLASWLSGYSVEESAAAGNVTGAFSTQRPGGTEAFRLKAEREQFLHEHQFPVIRSRAVLVGDHSPR